MKKKYWIYLALLVFGAIGSTLDVTLVSKGSRYLHYVIQLCGNVYLCVWWQHEDAKDQGTKLERWVRAITILFIPIGILIYSVRTRKWWKGIGLTVGFLGGYIAFVSLADSINACLFL